MGEFSLDSLKSLRKSSSIEAIKQKIASSEGQKKDYSDDRFWSVSKDEVGNGSAVVRFLPWAGMKEGDLEYVQQFEHSFKHNGQWYIELCRTTIGDNDPVVEYANKLWTENDPATKNLRASMKRKMSYIANVYIVKDPANPDNEGKVKLFKFGAKIMEKLKDAINPKFDDENPVNPFSLFEDGANVKLRMKKVDGQTNWASTVVEQPSAFANGDEKKMVEIMKQTFKLSEFTDPDRFKTYEVLDEKLHKMMKGAKTDSNQSSYNADEDVFESKKSPSYRSVEAPTPRSKPNDDDDLDAFFGDE